MGHYPYSASDVLRNNQELNHILWSICQTIKTQKPIYSGDNCFSYAFHGNKNYNYLFTFTPEEVIVSVTDPKNHFREELETLEKGYVKSIYFPLVLVTFNRKELKGYKADEHYMNLGLYSKSSLRTKKESIVKIGDINSINVHLDLWQDFLTSLQEQKLFPEGDIDKALKQVGYDVGVKNSAHELAQRLYKIYDFFQQHSINHIFSYCDAGKLYFDKNTSSFVMDEKKYGYVINYQQETNTWQVFSFGNNFINKTANDVLSLLKQGNVNFVRDVSVEIQNEQFTYVGSHLVNLDCDLQVVVNGIPENSTLKIKP